MTASASGAALVNTARHLGLTLPAEDVEPLLAALDELHARMIPILELAAAQPPDDHIVDPRW